MTPGSHQREADRVSSELRTVKRSKDGSNLEHEGSTCLTQVSSHRTSAVQAPRPQAAWPTFSPHSPLPRVPLRQGPQLPLSSYYTCVGHRPPWHVGDVKCTENHGTPRKTTEPPSPHSGPKQDQGSHPQGYVSHSGAQPQPPPADSPDVLSNTWFPSISPHARGLTYS